MATPSSYTAGYSHHHHAASVHSSVLHGLSSHPAVFEMSSSSPSLLYPSTPIRDLSGSASVFSHSEEPLPASSLNAFISSLAASPPNFHSQQHSAAVAQQYYVHPSNSYEDGLPIQAQHTSPSHNRLQAAALSKDSLNSAEYSAQLRQHHQQFLRQAAASDAEGISPLSGHSESHTGGDVFSNHSSDGCSSRVSSSAASGSTPSSSPNSFASLPRDGRHAAQPLATAANLPTAAVAAPCTPVFHDAVAAFPPSPALLPSSPYIPARKRKGQLNNRKVACHVCHLAKTSCDGARPCSRCVRLGKQPLCVDRRSKVAKVGEADIVSARPVFAAAVPAAVLGATETGNILAAAAASAAAAGGGAAASSVRVDRNKQEKLRSREERKTAEDDRDDSEEQRSDSDSHCSDEEDEEEDGQQQRSGSGSDDSDAASSLDSPPSPSSHFPPTSRPFNMDERLSRSLLRAHLRWNERQRQGDAACVNSMQRMNLREKLVYFTWLTNMMRPEHVEELVHKSAEVEEKVKVAKERKQKEDAAAEDGAACGRAEAGKDSSDCRDASSDRAGDRSRHTDRRSRDNKQRRSSSSSSSSPRSSAYKPCDGGACDNFCPSARVWAATNPCCFTWHHSPEEAFADSASSYPQLVLRCLADEDVSAEQNRRIVHNTLMLRRMEKIGEWESRAFSRSVGTMAEEAEEKTQQQEQQQQQLPAERKVDAAAEAAADAASSSGSASSVSGLLQFDDMGSFSYLFRDCEPGSGEAACFASPDDRAAFHEFNRRQSEQPAFNTTTTVAVSNAGAASSSQSPSASSSSPFAGGQPLSATLSLPPQPPIEVAMSVCVNAAFERLFGWSQTELRQHLIRDGCKTLYLLTRRDSWERLMELDQEANWGQQHEYRTYAVCVNKYRGEIHCLLHTVYSFNDDGKFSDSRTTFIPLPDPRPPDLRDDDDEDDDRRRRRKGKTAKNRKASTDSKAKSRAGKRGSRGGSGTREDRAERDERD